MNILELAWQAGFEYGIRAEYEPELERFAALIRQQERERIAKACDRCEDAITGTNEWNNGRRDAYSMMADAIRGMKDE